MSESEIIYKLDSKTMLDLAKAHDELAEFVLWLGERDIEASERIKSISLRISGIMLAVIAGNDPDFAPVYDAIDKAEDQYQAALAKATTVEEVEAIRRTRAEGWKILNETIQTGLKNLQLRAESEKKEPRH
jgi:hypothetical protein